MKKELSNNQILNLIAQGIFDKKGQNILVLDVTGINTMTDVFVIAEGTSDRHVKSLANYLITLLEPYLGLPYHSEGLAHSDWVVLDYYDIVIHLLTSELRDRYSLEKLWTAGHIVDVIIDIHSPYESTTSKSGK